VAVFGPNQAAAQLEGSKGFTKDLCARTGIPTAGYVRTRDPAALAQFGLPVVIKADGLAAGKGVVIAETSAEAEAAIAAADGPVVVEEFLEGEEVSFFALTDGQTIVPFGSAQDHKRVGKGDTGPNTGGMGAYSVLTPELEAQVLDEIVRPTVRAMAEAGIHFSGVLYAGLMLTTDGPKLIEYNVRFGDPECQVLMMRLETDLLDLLLATAQRRLADVEPPRFSDGAAVTVVLAAEGYPGTPAKGGAISGVELAEAIGAKVFHAGTELRDGRLVANGGRVLGVTASGATVASACALAYKAMAAIDFPTGFHRRDIGWREIERERASDQPSAR
jgi:phosphoribosylamine--glycine ligase